MEDEVRVTLLGNGEETPRDGNGHNGTNDNGTDEKPDADKALSSSRAGTSADVSFTTDIFDAVVVSAFGGITQRLSKDECIYVHPIIMFFLSLSLVVVQASTLVYLRLDQELLGPVWTKLERKGAEGVQAAEAKEELLMTLKILMVIVGQLMLFTKIMRTTRMLVFLLNPVTWEDIERPDPFTMKTTLKWLYHPWMLAPPAIAALALHLAIDYNICVDAVSIILGSDSCRTVIYDSLAITFIADLGTVWWTVMSTVFHFEPFDGFIFRMANEEMRKNALEHSRIPSWLKPQFLHHGTGGRGVEVIVTFLAMFEVYRRQLFLVAHALVTDVLPVARDVCTFWRWQNRGARYLRVISYFFRVLEDYLLVKNPEEAIKYIADPAHGGYCNRTYDRMRRTTEWDLVVHHPYKMWTGICIIVVFVILPQAFLMNNKRIRRWFYKEEDYMSLKIHRLTAAEELQVLRRDVNELKLKQKQANQPPPVEKSVDEPVEKSVDVPVEQPAPVEDSAAREEARAAKEEAAKAQAALEDLRGQLEAMRRDHAQQQQDMAALREELNSRTGASSRSLFRR